MVSSGTELATPSGATTSATTVQLPPSGSSTSAVHSPGRTYAVAGTRTVVPSATRAKLKVTLVAS
jgi:hypothetical protein